MSFNELKIFIAEARRNTYASGKNSVEKPLLIGSHQFEYRKGDYFYRDIYFGGEENFTGQEVVYQSDKPIWSMVYCGSVEPEEISDFLKNSLLNLSKKCRFGEECEFEEGDLKYEDKGEGTLERFIGKEQIFIKDESVYELNYQGVLISK